jgi:flavin-dependent dehydrogenase
VLVGDAWGFIDPVYSSGVYFALKTGEMAADCVVDGLRRGDTSAERLGRWTDDFAAGARWIRKLVEKYYDADFSIGRFMKSYPQHRGNLTDLLIGRVFYDGAGNIFDDMDPWLERARQSAK